MIKRVGLTIGYFDLLHIGHLKHIQKCKEHCDFLIVGVFSDEIAALYKRRSVIPVKERLELINALKPVDMAVKIEHRNCQPELTELKKNGWNIKFYFYGKDSTIEKWGNKRKTKEFLESDKAEPIQISYHNPRSTTGIINEILRREKEGKL